MANEVKEAGAAEVIAWLRSPEGEYWSEQRLMHARLNQLGAGSDPERGPGMRISNDRWWREPDVIAPGLFSVERQPSIEPHEEAGHE